MSAITIKSRKRPRNVQDNQAGYGRIVGHGDELMKRHRLIAYCAPFLLLACREPVAPAVKSVNGTAPMNTDSSNRIKEGDAPSPRPAGAQPGNSYNLRMPGTAANSEVATPPYRMTERKFLSGDSLSALATERILNSSSFDAVASEFEREVASDRDAQDLTHLYRKEIQHQLGNSARLASLNCGGSLCLGTILTYGDNSAYSTWSDVFFESPRTPNYVFSETTLKRGQNFENRFVFSTDPAVNSVKAPPQKR